MLKIFDSSKTSPCNVLSFGTVLAPSETFTLPRALFWQAYKLLNLLHFRLIGKRVFIRISCYPLTPPPRYEACEKSGLKAPADSKLYLVARFPQEIRSGPHLYGSIQGLRVVCENQAERSADHRQNELNFQPR
jgi:hypothetical protein